MGEWIQGFRLQKGSEKVSVAEIFFFLCTAYYPYIMKMDQEMLEEIVGMKIWGVLE